MSESKRYVTVEEFDRAMQMLVARQYFGVESPEDIPAKLKELAEQPNPALAAFGIKVNGA